MSREQRAAMDTTSEPTAIFDATLAVRHVFKAAIAAPRLMYSEWAENRLADFDLWCASTGASTTGELSLDHQWHTIPEVRAMVIDSLSTVKTVLQNCIDQGQETKNSYTELCDWELSNMKEVESSLSLLAWLTLTIHKEGDRSASQGEDSDFEQHEPQIHALNRHLQVLLLTRPNESGSSDASAQQLDPTRLTSIQQRLIDANLRRRNRILNAQQHAQKLRHDFEHFKNSSSPTQAFAGLSLSQANPIADKHDIQAQDAKAAKVVEDRFGNPHAWLTAPSTVLSVTSSQITYPKAPLLHDSKLLFMCPCCCQCLTAAAGQGNQWKKHLMGDILPYTCIVENCAEPGNRYADRVAWLNHMNEEHGGAEEWKCFSCSKNKIHLTFEQLTDLIAHFEQHHNTVLQPPQVHGLLSGWRYRVPYEITACPLCLFEGADQDALIDHTAAHVHSFSLKSLPWALREGLEEDCNGDEEYFKIYPYFEAPSFQQEPSSRSPDVSSPADTDSGEIVDSDLANDVKKQQRLTEDILERVPDDVLNLAGMSKWVETLDSAGDTESRKSVDGSCDTATKHDKDKAGK